jgi:NUMOD4 motif
MREIERPIEGYPNYSVTNYGRVINHRTGRDMVLTPNTQGELTVGLVEEGYQRRYSVKCMVAREFVEGESEQFDTPILLDGDVYNVRADNIVWRPRWFAWRYKHQFSIDPPWYTAFPVIDVVSQEEYNSVVGAAITNGLLCVDILTSIYNEVVVFPTRQLFMHVM